MGNYGQRISPLLKQCFVTTGVSLNMAASGLVVGFGAALLSQLKEKDSDIPIDDSSGSWIASLPGFFVFVGNLLVIPIMGKFGRRTANLVSISLLTATWFTIVFTPNITLLLIARAFQGIYMGMSTALSSLLIGEYTSPRNRGAFLMTISISISLGVLFVHAFGSFLSWRTSAMICVMIALVDLMIVVFSPESPSWLASQGRYEECMKVFRWLRGDTEEEELKKMIEVSMSTIESKIKSEENESFGKKIENGWKFFNTTIRKKEFYKPLIIMAHMYTIGMWGGVNILVVYVEDFIHKVVGLDVNNMALLIMTFDLQRVISNTIAIFLIKKIRRRVMLFTTVGINIAALVSIAGYTYAKFLGILPFDHPMIGIFLAHCMMFAIASGSLSLSFILAGEIFPLEFKTLAGGVSVIIYSASLFLSLKSIPYIFAHIGVYGACCMSSILLCYCLTIVGFLLPETKDRTLLDIEEEFRGPPNSRKYTKNTETISSTTTV